MASKLSFAIAINLLTENFKRGTNQVKAGFKAMQMQVLTFAAALGAGGLGLSNFVSRLIDVVRETNRVTTALKNVSGSTGQFADNQRYLLDLAKKYGLEINALTGNFAKFTAAASISGMSMGEQRKIFESVSRACTAFGMSADDSNGVFLALSQMMSKGKISSEELRLQMGERLPIALQAMAKAAGVSVAGLDKLLKQGKLMSADVLPKFADALNDMIPNVDTDNLETSVNRLKNVFTEFTKSIGIENLYKGLVDGCTTAVLYIQNNLKTLLSWIVSAVSGYIGGKVISYLIIEFAKMQRAAMIAAKRMAKEAGQAFDEAAFKAHRFYNAATAGAAKLNLALKAAVKSLAPMMLIAGIMQVIQVIGMWRDRQREVNEKYKEYQRGAQKAGAGNYAEVIKLTQLRDIVNDTNNSYKTRVGALNQLNKLLGTAFSIDSKTLKINGDINKAIQQRVALMRNTSMADYYTNQFTQSLQDRRNLMERKQKIIDKYNAKYPDTPINADDVEYDYDSFVKDAKDILLHKALEIITKDLANTNRIVVDSDKKSKLYSALVAKEEIKIPVTNLEPNDKEKKTPLEKQQESFDKQFAELGAELEIGKLTQAEYNKALAELNVKMYAQAKGTNDKKVLESDYFKARKTAAEQAVKSMPDLKAKVELEKVEKEYTDARSAAKAKLEKGLIAEDGYREAIVDAAMKAAESAASIEGVGTAADEFIKKMRNVAINNTLVPVLKQRDTTFDYKATEVDKAADNLDAAKDYAKQLQEAAKAAGQTLSDALANAIAGVPDLEKALKLAEIKEDVKNFTKELTNLKWDAAKGIVGDVDNLVNAFKNLANAFDPDSEADGWERLMALWNLFSGVVDSIMSVCDTLEAITKLTNMLAGAKEKEAAIDTATTGVKVANAAVGATADITAAEVKKQTATEEVAANTASAASESGKSAAKLPFPWNIVAIGGAIAAAIAAFAVIPKFATGGIVTGGPSSGDKILARVNAGEMILNHGQQSRLFEAINSGRLGNSQQINIGFDRVRGADILLAVNNTLKRQGKKPIS